MYWCRPIQVPGAVLLGCHLSYILQWRHNGLGGVANHRRLHCLHNWLFRRRSKKTSKLRVAGLCKEKSPVNSPHKRTVTRKMFPFDNLIMHSISRGHLFPTNSQKTPQSSPERARYVCLLWDGRLKKSSRFLVVVIFSILCYIRLRYIASLNQE